MGAERVDYYSEEEYQQACECESQAWDEQEQEPDTVLCIKCGREIRLIANEQDNNICSDCLN